jgi:hypothetical protein
MPASRRIIVNERRRKVILILIITILLLDRRLIPCSPSQKYVVENTVTSFFFKTRDFPEERRGWLRRFCRVRPETLDYITSKLVDASDHETKSSQQIRFKLAVLLSYLSTGLSHSQNGSIFGVGKTASVKYCQFIISLLMKIRKDVIFFPAEPSALREIASDFYSLFGFPNVAGAIDGTIVPITRPADYEGWYTRDGTTGFNVQAICTAQKLFLHVEIRAGCHNDKQMWSFTNDQSLYLLPGFHFLADAGYTLSSSLLIPYRTEKRTARSWDSNATFNYIHSQTRMVIESAYGLLKSRFRILLAPLEAKGEVAQARVIMACFVLHNFTVLLNDELPVRTVGEDPTFGANRKVPLDGFRNLTAANKKADQRAAAAKRKQIADLFFEERNGRVLDAA